MPSIEIPDDLYRRLEHHARGFDNPIAVIARAVDALESASDTQTPILDAPGDALFEALNPPDLRHTKVVTASFNGNNLDKANWKQLVETAVVHASKSLGNFSKLQKIAAANMVQGRRTKDGYHYLPEIDISLQGQDANGSWRTVSFIARNLKVPVEVSFLWRNRDGAENPGKPGTMRLYG